MIRLFLFVLACRLLTNLALADDRPNIVVFLVDDLGRQDLACYGSTFHETPNIDRLAREGALFTDAYAACPVCSPTRASLMTGLWPQRTGITDYIGAPLTPEEWKRNTLLLPAPYTDRLSLETTTLAEMAKSAGYATFFAGKWHLGPEGWWPEDQGFDVNMGGTDRGGPYGGNKYFSPYGNPRLKDGPEGEHLPDRLATETADFIEAHRDQPFLAYFSFYSVHTPLMSRDDLREKYEAKRKHLGLEEKWGREGERDVRLVQDHAVYAGMVEAMDLAVGKFWPNLMNLTSRRTLWLSSRATTVVSPPAKAGRLLIFHCEEARAGFMKAASANRFWSAGRKLWRLTRRFQNPSAARICSPRSLMSQRRRYPKIRQRMDSAWFRC
jgi:arylsulfatase A-like enzyme